MALDYYYGTKYSCADCGTPLEIDVIVSFNTGTVVTINKNYISNITGYNYRITGEASFDEFADVLEPTPYNNCSEACTGPTTTTTTEPPATTTTTLAPPPPTTTTSTTLAPQTTTTTTAAPPPPTTTTTTTLAPPPPTTTTTLAPATTTTTTTVAPPPPTTTSTTTVAPPPPTTTSTTTTLPPMSFTYSTSCAGGEGTGIITINSITGGTGIGYQYSIQPTPGIWYDYPTTNQLTGLANGTYTVAVRDSAGNGTSTPGISISCVNPTTTTSTTTSGPTTTTTSGPTTTTTLAPQTTTTTTTTAPQPTTTSTTTTIAPSQYDYYYADQYECSDCSTVLQTDTIVRFDTGTAVLVNKNYISFSGDFNYRIKGDASYDQFAPLMQNIPFNSCTEICNPTTTTTLGPTTTTTSGPTTTTTSGPTTTTTSGPTTTSTTTLSAIYDYYFANVYDCVDCGAPIEYDALVKFPEGTNVFLNRHYKSYRTGYNYRIISDAAFDPFAELLDTIPYNSCNIACLGTTTTTTTAAPTTTSTTTAGPTTTSTTTSGPTTTTTSGPTTTTTSGPTTTTTAGPTTTTTAGPTTTTTAGPTTTTTTRPVTTSTTTTRPPTTTTTTTTIGPSSSYTITYSPNQNGWTSFHSFQPEWMVALNSGFYSFKNGNLYRHYSNSNRNSYYGIVYPSSITTVFNNEPTQTKKFKTIATNSTVPWDTVVTSDQGSGSMKADLYDLKEGTYYAYIRRNANDNNLSMISAQGVGNLLSISGNTLTFSFNVGSIISDGDLAYWVDTNNNLVLAGTVSSHSNNTITLSNVGTLPTAGKFILYIKNSIAESTPTKGTYLQVNLTATSEEYSEIVSVSSEVFKSFS